MSALKLDPNRPMVTPKAAATLLFLRERSSAVEVFCVRRHARSAFLGGAVVFPGGKLDEEDGGAELGSLCSQPHPRAELFADDPDHARSLAICACRESLEEAALLPTDPLLDDAAVRQMRRRIEGGACFAQLIRSARVKLDVSSLVPFARWVTPVAEQRRYDARFFIARAPRGQQGEHDEHETTMSLWSQPAQLLQAASAGDLWLAPPTLRCLELLAEVRNVDAALALAEEQTLLPICPTFVPGDPPMLVIAGDPLHEIESPRVSGSTRFVLRDGRFVSGQ